MTQALTRSITVEHFHPAKEQADVCAQCGTTEQTLRDVLCELQDVLREGIIITLHEVTVEEGDSRLTVGNSETIRLTCAELGIASMPLDEILNPDVGMGCCAECPSRANPEACCKTLMCGEDDSDSIPIAQIVVAILKLAFYS